MKKSFADILQDFDSVQKRKLATKIPEWADTEGLQTVSSLALEQCSSSATARYKASLAARILAGRKRTCIADLTGGLGVDSWAFSQVATKVVYNELNTKLFDAVRENFRLLGCTNISFSNTDALNCLPSLGRVDLVYLDPSRRDKVGKKVFLLEDCEPDVLSIKTQLLSYCPEILLKLSPMADISLLAERLGPSLKEVHVVGTDGECKELLLVMHQQEAPLRYYCVNITDHVQETVVEDSAVRPVICRQEKGYLYEPNASILKAGVQDALCNIYKVEKLHAFSHLFTSDQLIEDFPGRSFRIIGRSDFSKQGLKNLLAGVKQANLTVRNFPATVQELKKKLKLADGGSVYLFATTMSDDTHALLRCEKC